MTKKSTRFRYQIGDTVVAKNLPVELIDKGFLNGNQYRMRFGWLTDAKQSYYIQLSHFNLILQSGDGIVTGYAQFFDVQKRNA